MKNNLLTTISPFAINDFRKFTLKGFGWITFEDDFAGLAV